MTSSHLLQFILAHDTRHLQVTLHLLSDLLETVHDRNTGDSVDSKQKQRYEKKVLGKFEKFNSNLNFY